MTAVELVVKAIDDGVPGVRTLTLARADGATLPSFTPGSHLVIECGGKANAYSLTSDSVAPCEYTVSVLECLDGAGGSRWIHQELAVGDRVLTRPPRSAFAPVLRARRHLLVAAGIGITPMVSHLRSAARWGRQTQVLYLHRDGRGAYLDEVKSLTDEARTYTERATFLADLLPALANQPFGTHLYVCGPASFMDDVIASAVQLGWPGSRIHLERFGIDALDPGEPFEVTLTARGESFVVDSGVSLLEALQARGHDIPNLCRQGVCGECRVPVAAGEILHRDLYLSDADKQACNAMMSCVSRAVGGRIELSL
ncbi:PDR/VanB family oxidoreductase [Mycolicibacterium tokaiense]|uniref:Ferredoxin n=1 Tax=Mycolicibacterium tokaiense TaxID=39695 RepID=A0A378TL88_9MYCO|nr:PDR/VanB family oxidoreductase [Mycolicibacterium tokaiense]BBY90222.1 ferredoxin [Mycolicibacterium tokaiense]STZ61390.1 ferredoxin [Mycolicibacterium tokaiense]